MHAFPLTMIPAHIGTLISIGKSLGHAGKGHEDFLSAIREARSRLGRFGEGNGPGASASAITRRAGSRSIQGREMIGEGKETREGSGVELRDLTPLAVLLHESGVSAERTRAFFDSLTADAPRGKMPAEELLARIRAFLVEEGGDGRLRLEPAARLRVESALIGHGFSPEEAGRILSPASRGEGDVDVERFIRLTLMRRTAAPSGIYAEESQKVLQGGKRDPESRSAELMNRAGSRKVAQNETGASASLRTRTTDGHAASPADSMSPELSGGTRYGGIVARDPDAALGKRESPVAAPSLGRESTKDHSRAAGETVLVRLGENTAARKESGNPLFNQSEASRNLDPLSEGAAEKGAEAGGRFDRGKEGDGSDGFARTGSKASFDEGGTAFPFRSVSASGDGVQQTWVKPSGTPAPPLPHAENVIPSHVAMQVGKKISLAVQNGDQTIRFRLNPPRLGVVRVQLEWGPESLRIEMTTDRQPVKEVLLASVGELKQALIEQGFRVDKMEVQVNESFDPDLSAFDREDRDRSRVEVQAKNEDFSVSEEDRGEERIYPIGHQEHRLVDVVA